MSKTNKLIDEENIKFVSTKSSGPGGQHINKVSTGIQLLFDISNSKKISEKVKKRIFQTESNRINKDGQLIIKANRFRSQLKNKHDAILRLVEIIQRASKIKKRRLKTFPTLNSQENRIKRKKINSAKKSLRKRVNPDY